MKDADKPKTELKDDWQNAKYFIPQNYLTEQELTAFRKYISNQEPGIFMSNNSETIPTIKAPLEDDIRKMCNDLADFLVEKNRAYGNSAADPVDIFSRGLTPLQKIDVRIDDKLSRLQRGSEFQGDDTIKDLCGYLIIRMIIAEKENAKSN